MFVALFVNYFLVGPFYSVNNFIVPVSLIKLFKHCVLYINLLQCLDYLTVEYFI